MKALYAAATGMAAQQTRIDNIANNLANVNTSGFKKSRASFQDLFYQELATGGGEEGASPTSAQVGAGVRTVAVEKDHSAGSIQATGNPLDVAINGRGMFVLETSDGREVFTRDGHFNIDADGNLVNPSGMALSGGISIPEEAEEIVISSDGLVEYRASGDEYLTSAGQLEIAAFANPAGLRALGGNLFSASAESGDAIRLEIGTEVEVQQGALEGSNVDVAEELIAMVMAQRAYELTSKVVQAADETLQTAANLRR